MIQIQKYENKSRQIYNKIFTQKKKSPIEWENIGLKKRISQLEQKVKMLQELLEKEEFEKKRKSEKERVFWISFSSLILVIGFIVYKILKN